MAFLDVGCGVGITDEFLIPKVGKVHGIDVAEGVLAKAREAHPEVNYTSFDGKRMPFNDNSFDVSFAMCVFHHVLPEHRQNLVEEMGRVTRNDGLIVIFEHNPLNVFTQIAVRRCPLDEDAILLRPSETVRLMNNSGVKFIERGYILLTPWEVRLLSIIEKTFKKFPLGAQYFVAARVVNKPLEKDNG